MTYTMFYNSWLIINITGIKLLASCVCIFKNSFYYIYTIIINGVHNYHENIEPSAYCSIMKENNMKLTNKYSAIENQTRFTCQEFQLIKYI